MRTSPTGAAVALALALTVAVGGCSGDAQPTRTSTGTSTPSAAATPTPSVDPNDPQAVAYATATALFEDYFALGQEIRQEPGVPDWESVLGYTSGDVRMVNIAIYNSMVEDGIPQQGEARIVSIVPTSYEADSTGWADVVLTVCIDSSESDTPGWITDPLKSKPGQPDRVSLIYTVRAFPQPHLGDDVVFWAIDHAEILEGQAC